MQMLVEYKVDFAEPFSPVNWLFFLFFSGGFEDFGSNSDRTLSLGMVFIETEEIKHSV